MELQLFALKSSEALGNRIAERLEIPLSLHEERDFEDGEHKIRPLENVRGRDVFVLQSLYSDNLQTVNDKLIRLLFFIGSLKDAAAAHVTAVIPYLAYARKDRKTKSRDPISMKYIANLLESSGADQVMVMDVHNLSAYQNAFRIPTEHLEARVLFAPYFSSMVENEEVVIVSPDAGGVKRAEQFRTTLEDLSGKHLSKAYLEKERSEGVVKGGDTVIGDVKNKVAIIIDDIISSGKTIQLAVEALDEAGAKRIYVCATHGLFVGEASRYLDHPRLEKILVTDSIPPFRITNELIRDKIIILDSAKLFSKALKRAQAGDSLVNLLENYPRSETEMRMLN